MPDLTSRDDGPRRDRRHEYSRSRSRSPQRDRRQEHSSRRSDGRDRDDRDRDSQRRPRRERSPKYDSRRHNDSPTHDSRRQDRSQSPARRSRTALPSQDELFRRDDASGPPLPEKEKPNYKPTGLLAKEANTVAGTTTVLKYHEPPEGRKPPPSQQWRMYIFKGKDVVDTIQLYQRSCWLIGRDEKVTDVYLQHTSISKQHAVIQFRFSSTTNEYGDKINRVKPYLIDLESANGTKLNDKPIEQSRYIELVDGDVVAFANSEREYVMMLPAPDKK